MDLNLYENMIAAFLSESFPGIPVERCFGDPAGCELGENQQKILIRYAGSVFAASSEISETIQDAEHNFILSLLALSVDGDLGLYDMAAKICQSFIGYPFPAAEKTILKTAEPAIRTDDYWQFDLTLSFLLPEIGIDREVSGAQVKQLTFRNELNDDIHIPRSDSVNNVTRR